MEQLACGPIEKMITQVAEPVQYMLPLGDNRVNMNALLGKTIRLEYQGAISCTHCGRKTSKSFNQGYCFPCFKKLAQCDVCIVSPEKCHYEQGTCREPEWAEQYCMQDHFVYLANSSGIKVGITRGNQVPTRWLDQGATQALLVARVQTRQQSGLLEVALKAHVADKTNWRALLKGDADSADLQAAWQSLQQAVSGEVQVLQQRFGLQAIQLLQAEVQQFSYPVWQYPAKITSLNLDKTPVVSGVLQGIKGQYLMLDCGVINMRKYTAYHLALSAA